MDQAEKTMMDNLLKITGKSLDDWKKIALASGLEKHGEILNFLKETHGLTYGYANFIVHKAKGSDAGSVGEKNELVENQYRGKENLRPFYETLMAGILKLGSDVEVSPKNASVSLRRKKQFCLLEPKTKIRLEVGLNMKGVEPQGILESYGSNTMCSHKIRIESAADITPEVFDWIKKAYEQAG